MAESEKDRRRAAKLRRKKSALTPEQKKFLDAYSQRVARVKSRSAPPPVDLGGPRRTLAAPKPPTVDPVVRGPQLPLAAVAVHTTQPPPGNVAPEAYQWTPTTPPLPEGAGLPPPGAPQPPPEGTPLVDVVSPQAPPADPAAAEQFAALVMLVTTIGIDSGRELLTDVAIPETFRTVIESDEARARALVIVGAAAKNVAVKYGFRSMPMADEAVVIASCAGSLAAFVAVQKKKMKTKKARAPQVAAPEAPPPVPTSHEIDRLFRESAS